MLLNTKKMNIAKQEQVHDKSAQTDNIEDEAYPCCYCGSFIKVNREEN